MKSICWEEPGVAGSLRQTEVHVWRALLSPSENEIRDLAAMLPEGERNRAGQFHSDDDRRRFIVGRSALRSLLGRYLGIPPEGIELRSGASGKPWLEMGGEGVPLEFNVSHSGEVVVLAFATARRVGIDVERVRLDLACDEIAERFFSEPEQEDLQTLPAMQRKRAFFRCWTRKEAFVKAIGRGLQVPLRSFCAGTGTANEHEILSDDGCRWKISEFEPDVHHAAAVAAEGTDWQARYFAWTAARS